MYFLNMYLKVSHLTINFDLQIYNDYKNYWHTIEFITSFTYHNELGLNIYAVSFDNTFV